MADARLSQVTVDQLADDTISPTVRLSQLVVDYFSTPVSQCVGGGGIGVVADPAGGETFVGRTLSPRAWLALGFDA